MPSTCKAWQEALGMETQDKGHSLSPSGIGEASQRMDDTNKNSKQSHEALKKLFY